jgi:PhnB protein
MPFINPYLNFNGTTEEAFKFYKSVFGGEFQTFQRFSEMPGGEKTPEAEKNRIVHVSLPIGKNNLLMGSDTMPSMGHTLTIGSNYHISVGTETEDEAKKVFDGLAQGGRVTMPLDKMFWNAYFGMVIDKFGVQWMVSCDLNKK